MTGLTASNPKIQRLRRLSGRRSARLDEGVYVVEGATLVAEAVAAGVLIEAVYVEVSAAHLAPPGVPVIEVADGVMAKVGSTTTPQPILAVVTLPGSLDVVGGSFLVVCAGVADPGNAGTILRSAEAAGADAVAFTPGSVDPFNPKCVRASAGALFHVPVLLEVDPTTLDLPLVGTSAADGIPHTEFDFRAPFALVLGNETHGLDPDLELDALVRIDHRGRSESLNVAMAATVLCFEAARQRR